LLRPFTHPILILTPRNSVAASSPKHNRTHRNP
jgi:hypothetical protein